MSTIIQARCDERDKEEAGKILEELGTNYSAVINMLLKQIIRTRSIPFDVKLGDMELEIEKRISEVDASMRLEDMELSAEDLEWMREYAHGNQEKKEQMRKQYIDEMKE